MGVTGETGARAVGAVEAGGRGEGGGRVAGRARGRWSKKNEEAGLCLATQRETGEAGEAGWKI
jgi:hypothetical protein